MTPATTDHKPILTYCTDDLQTYLPACKSHLKYLMELKYNDKTYEILRV